MCIRDSLKAADRNPYSWNMEFYEYPDGSGYEGRFTRCGICVPVSYTHLGANIKKLLKLCPKGKVQGIDYSAVSIEKARKVNAGAIAEGRCNVQQASVAELPFEAEQFDVATAFETVYFWPELAQNFREVYRVLKPGGTFFICNEANGETAKDDKWTQIINGMTIYTDADLKVYLEQAGFGRVQSHKNKKGWLCVTAQK